MADATQSIKDAIAEALVKSEEKGDVVIATSVINNVTEPVAEAVKAVYAGIFTNQELAAKQFSISSNVRYQVLRLGNAHACWVHP
jgi:predicted nucleic acid-binding protein